MFTANINYGRTIPSKNVHLAMPARWSVMADRPARHTRLRIKQGYIPSDSEQLLSLYMPIMKWDPVVNLKMNEHTGVRLVVLS